MEFKIINNLFKFILKYNFILKYKNKKNNIENNINSKNEF